LRGPIIATVSGSVSQFQGRAHRAAALNPNLVSRAHIGLAKLWWSCRRNGAGRE
jgi:hypothetical protein